MIGNASEKAKAPQIKTAYLGYNVSSENEKRIHNYFKDTDVNIIKMTKKYGWTKDVLINHIENKSYENI